MLNMGDGQAMKAGDEENQKHADSGSDTYLKTKQDAVCFDCNLPIKGVIVKALNQTWHPEHFCCAHCKKPISGQKFNVEDNQPYCVDDYTQLFLKRCQGCNLPIRDVVIVALNSYWHFDHFVCATCGTRLSNNGFYERENNAFCQNCYEEKFCPKCHGCNKPIVKTAVMALGEKWHEECFKCSKCSKPITEPTFEISNGKQLCERCTKEIDIKLTGNSAAPVVPLSAKEDYNFTQ